MITLKEITDEWIERRKPAERRKVERIEVSRRSNYDASKENIMYASYDRSIIDSQLKALKQLKGSE